MNIDEPSISENIPDDQESFDQDLAFDVEVVEPEIDNPLVYEYDFNIDNTFIVIFEEDDEPVDKLLVVQEKLIDDKKVILIDEENNQEIFDLNNDNRILLKTNNYTILEIEEVEEFDFKEIDTMDLLVIKDLYPEIEIDVKEKKVKDYSLQEKKESLLTELITSLNAFNNVSLINQISDIVEHFVKLFKEDHKIPSDSLQFIQDIENNKPLLLPKWIIPIVQNSKRLYKKEDEDKTEHDDIIIKHFETELEEKYKLQTSPENTYKDIINSLNKFTPFQNNGSLLIPYNGFYFRYCGLTNTCHGIQGELSSDINKTKDELIIPIEKENITSFETISPQEQLSIIGFYILPSSFINITMDTSPLSIHELYYLSDFKYSYNLIKDRMKDEPIYRHMMELGSINTDEDWNDTIHSFILNDKESTIDDLPLLLKNHFPSYSNIIETVPKKIRKIILNHDDLRKMYLSFNIEYKTLDKENRVRFNEIIKENIKNYIKTYNKNVKRKVVKPIKKKNNILSTKDKIRLSLSYIMNLHIIPIRNNYIQLFINSFAREPNQNEDKSYYYQKGSDERLLCKHYQYIKDSHLDINTHNTVKSLFGSQPQDGNIYCKVCGDFLCTDNFSSLEGFSDGSPTSSKEVLNTDDSDLQILNKKQLKTKKRIQKISSLFGVKLNQYDIQTIIDYNELLINDSLTNIRYGVESKAIENHPMYKEKKLEVKNNKDKSINKKKLWEQKKSYLMEFFNDCNEVLINLFLILFIIQISSPPYPISSKFSIHLWDFPNEKDELKQPPWKEINKDIIEKISIDTIQTIQIILNQIVTLNKKDNFWINIKEFLNESIKYNKSSFPTFPQQFLNISSFILRNAEIKNKLKNYYENQSNQYNFFLKEDWITYKPSIDNILVKTINEKINQELKGDMKNHILKNGTQITYENISSIISINDAYLNPRYKILNISFSEIMKNESYERLFKYSMHLHGKSNKPIPILNLLIQRFIDTISDKTIEPLLDKIGWDKNKKMIDRINYSEFKEVFIQNIINHFEKKNVEEIDTIKIYVHVHINNWNGMLLSGNSKRIYSYELPIIFPDETYEELIDRNIIKINEEEKSESIIDKLFSKYCIDDDDQIKERYDQDQFIYNLLANPTIQKEVVCDKLLPKTNENFHKILEFKRNSCSLSLVNKHIYDSSFENRIYSFIINNNLLLEDADPAHPILTNLIEGGSQNYAKAFNTMIEYNASALDKIQDFINQSNKEQLLENKQIRRFKSSFGRSLESMNVLIQKFLDNSTTIHNSIYHIITIVARLSNRKRDITEAASLPIGTPLNSPGTVFHNDIPKEWKLSETNKERIQDFLSFN